ncbi:MAG: hypothetical protein WCR55_04930 [Lentisphaerota bacterium]
MDYYQQYTKTLPKPITIAIMIPLVMIFLFLVVPVLLFFVTIVFCYSYIMKRKYLKNRHYQEFDKSYLSKIKSKFTKSSGQSASDTVVDIECKTIENDKLKK